ncbi:MAG: hypothetical protein J7639_21505 [Paenibacillaceae bacterium]|nr:hypothetical protein [Paenibacillaceae bacterium]
MTETVAGDLRLIGTNTSGGGSFGTVKITGEAVLLSDTSCRKFGCTGTLQVNGSMRADEFRLTGECKVEGDFRAGRLRTIGQLEVAGSVRGGELKVTGEMRMGAAGCEVDRLTVSGIVRTEGLISADSVDIRLYGPARAGEIGGGSITVRRARIASFKHLFQPQHAAGELDADTIEGDVVHLEYTRAAVVRGNRVTIGPGCDIGCVEYRESFSRSAKSVVREEARV